MATLFVAAVAEELGDLPGAVLGVGPIIAAASAGALVAVQRPSRVILVGTAGAYEGGPAVGQVVVSGRLGWSDGVAVMGLGYVPRPPAPLVGDADMASRSGLRVWDVLTTGAITTDAALCARLGQGFHVEHMEAFGVARACADHGVPFVAVLGITNRVGPDAHAEWLRNRVACQDAARAGARAVDSAAGG